MAITKARTLKYVLLPGIIPRIMAFFASGFSCFAYYIAVIYSIAGLLPKTHPYLLSKNIGHYGVRHVIAEAANNLVLTRKNIDQMLIFFIVLLGLTLMIVQIVLLGVAFIAEQPAFALDLSVSNLLQNPNSVTNSQGPAQDMAFIILDRVFGMENIYNSCVSTDIGCEDSSGNIIPGTESMTFPFPLHLALHTMLQFYSIGILAIGALIIIYFVTTIVAETATTGTPFGQRFSKAWVPFRLVMFFALLIPLNIGGTHSGLNGAQIITLWVAKHGSNFATNGWTYFNTVLTGTYMGQQKDLIALPNPPEVRSLNQFMLVAKTCAYAEKAKFGHTVKPYIVRSPPPAYMTGAPAGPPGSPDALPLMTTNFETAHAFSLGGTITVRYGVQGKDLDGDGFVDDDRYRFEPGHVFSYCGDVSLPVISNHEPGAKYISEAYYNMLQEMWSDSENNQVADCLVQSTYAGRGSTPTCSAVNHAAFMERQNARYSNMIETAIEEGIEKQREDGEFNVPDDLLEKGWGGAAIWFNRIAEMNGAVTTATYDIPMAYRNPFVLEETYEKRVSANADVTSDNRYELRLSEGERIELTGHRELIHPAVHKAYIIWADADAVEDETTGMIAIDLINKLIGTRGLFEMRQNADVHPLAQLTALGKNMMETAVRNAAIALSTSAAAAIGSVIDGLAAQLASTVSSFTFSLVTITIGIAAILYYVLPILPFIYFIFALSGWIKSIFEAVVAMPLWALAHLRIDGEGLPGSDASNGYFLLFEIFIRPILILFGLIASMSIFGGLVYTLNNVFDLMVGNIGGTNQVLENRIADGVSALPTSIAFYRGPVDEFFFTAMYAIICYMFAISSFKLIDQIPSKILRWMGSMIATFQENAGDPAGKITSNVHRGSLLITNQVKGTTQGNLPLMMG